MYVRPSSISTAFSRCLIANSRLPSKEAISPDTISKAVLERGLDAQTAFQIVSIDIADIEVGENIGARLQADQAEADTRVARAKAEERRAVAIAHEQEMKAATAENRAGVLKAEALVPKSIGEALRAGRMQSQSGNGRV